MLLFSVVIAPGWVEKTEMSTAHNVIHKCWGTIPIRVSCEQSVGRIQLPCFSPAVGELEFKSSVLKKTKPVCIMNDVCCNFCLLESRERDDRWRHTVKVLKGKVALKPKLEIVAKALL